MAAGGRALSLSLQKYNYRLNSVVPKYMHNKEWKLIKERKPRTQNANRIS